MAKPAHGLTVGALFGDYLGLHIAKAKNPVKSVERDKGLFEWYLSTLRAREIGSLTRAELRDLHAKLGEENGPVSAIRALELLKRTINWGLKTERHEFGNVAAGIEGFPEYSRERVAQRTELQRLHAALRDEKTSPDLRDYVHLALLTAARKGDVLGMKWADINLLDAIWMVPPTTKSGWPYELPLVPRALEILNRRKNDSAFVFPGLGASGHLVDPKKGWKELLTRVQIKNFTMHDLRRTVATAELKGGTPMAVIGRSLGHSAGSSATSIYARPSLEQTAQSLRAATDDLRRGDLTLQVLQWPGMA